MSSTINAVVIGLGGRGLWMAPQVAKHEAYSLRGVCDQVAETAHRVANTIGNNVQAYTDVDTCLRNSACDAVFVCTPDGTHADVVIPALEAGAYVFVEKPLDITLDACRKILDADRKAGGRTSVGFNLRLAPVYVTLRDKIQSGLIGQPLTIEACEFYSGGRTYFRRWNRLRSAGGGLWITKACHDFDILYWMAGTNPVRVAAFSELTHYVPKPAASLHCRDCALADDCPDAYEHTPYGPELAEAKAAMERATGERPDLCLFNSDKDTFDHGTATVQFENGVTASYTVNVVASFTRREIRVSGTDGCLEGNLGTGSVLFTKRDSNEQQTIDLTAEGSGGHGGGDDYLLSSFAEFVCGQNEHRIVRPEEATVAVSMGLAAREAADSGTVVPVELITSDTV